MSESYAVLGGEGFLGHAIVKMLCERYPSSQVVSLDIQQRHTGEKQGWKFENCDLNSLESLTSTFSTYQTTTVIHTASPWTEAGKELCEKVNVQGTKTVVEACQKTGVKKLVYTSSAGVVFDGSDIINVDERAGPPEVPMDAYNDTKARAEAIVLAANGQGGLLTCAIRPAGIYGPGDRQNIPGWLNVYKQGKTKFTIGDNKNIFDLSYVDNVVHAHLLAAEKLGQKVSLAVFDERIKPTQGCLPRRKLPTSANAPLSGGKELSDEEKAELDPPLPAARNRFDQWFNVEYINDETGEEDGMMPIAGEAYYISNGEPVVFWAWGKAIWYEYAQHDKKALALPAAVGLAYAKVLDVVSMITRRPNLMSETKIKYSVAKRYYNIEKARRMLGYEPIVGLVEGLERSTEWYKQNEASTAPPPAKTG